MTKHFQETLNVFHDAGTGDARAEPGKPTDVTSLAVRFDAHTRLRNILARNREFLDLASPTAAQRNAQVERNTRALNLLIRLVLAADDYQARDLIEDDPGRE